MVPMNPDIPWPLVNKNRQFNSRRVNYLNLPIKAKSVTLCTHMSYSSTLKPGIPRHCFAFTNT